MSEGAESVFAWSVQKLKQLNFDGDADALAAYVDALIENNRESEGGDKALLRSRTYKELEEFLGQHEVTSFVKALMAHLARVEAAAAAVSASEAPSRPNPSPVAPSQGSQPSQARGQAMACTQRSGDRSSKVLSTSQGRGNGSAVSNDSRHEAPHPGHDSRSLQGQGSDTRDHTPQGSRDNRHHMRNPPPRRKEVPPSGAPSADLRHQISRSRGSTPQTLPSKRAREFDEREREEAWSADRGDREGRGHPRDRDYSRNDERGRNPHDPAEPPAKNPRQHVGPGPGRPAGGGPGPGMVPMQGGVPAGRGSRFGYQGGPPPVGAVQAGGMPGMPPPPEFLQQMQHMMAGGASPGFPPPPAMFTPPGMMGPPRPPFPGRGREAAVSGNGRVRGRDSGEIRSGANSAVPGGTSAMARQRQQTTGHPRGRSLNSVLVLRSVPDDKLSVGVINDFFKSFGSINNIMLRPTQKPDHAYIEFSQRHEAQAAHDSVEAVMGNRHVRLYWAREHDFELDGIPLQGVELAPAGGQRRPGQIQIATPSKPTATPAVAAPAAPAPANTEEDQEVILQRKRKEIAAAREEQLKTKAQRQAELNKLIEEQRSLLKQVEADGVSKEEKKKIAKQIKALSKQADDIRTLMKPKESGAKASAMQTSGAQAQVRPRGAMSADFRPKVARVSGATLEGLTPESVKKIFRDTVSVTQDNGVWVIEFATRRAAESATKAVGVLRKSFGLSSTISLSDIRVSAEAKTPKKDSTANPDVPAAAKSKPDEGAGETQKAGPPGDPVDATAAQLVGASPQ